MSQSGQRTNWKGKRVRAGQKITESLINGILERLDSLTPMSSDTVKVNWTTQGFTPHCTIKSSRPQTFTCRYKLSAATNENDNVDVTIAKGSKKIIQQTSYVEDDEQVLELDSEGLWYIYYDFRYSGETNAARFLKDDNDIYAQKTKTLPDDDDTRQIILIGTVEVVAGEDNKLSVVEVVQHRFSDIEVWDAGGCDDQDYPEPE